MPEQLDNETGIIVKSGEYTIEMSPVDSDKADVSDIITETENKYDEHDIVEYTDVFGVDTTIEYSAQFNGVKENIILERTNFLSMLIQTVLALKMRAAIFQLLTVKRKR